VNLRERLSPRRWRPARLALDTQGRYSELHVGELASAITMAAFLSLLPLLLVGIAVLGFFSTASSKDLAQEVIKNLQLDRSPQTADLISDAVRTAESSRKAASVLGLAGLLWTGLGRVVVGALRAGGRGLRGPRLARAVRPARWCTPPWSRSSSGRSATAPSGSASRRRPGVAPVGATRTGAQRFSRPPGRPSLPFVGRKRPEGAGAPDGNGDAGTVSDRRSDRTGGR